MLSYLSKGDKLLTKAEELLDLEMLDSLLTQYNCMPLVMLDGFITGILSLDRVVMPSEWYKHVGCDQIDFESEADVKIFFELLTDFYNANIDELLEQTYDPLVIDENEDLLQISAKLWTSGYTLGLSLDGVEWFEQLPEDIFTMLMLLFAFSLPDKDTRLKFKQLFKEEISEIQVTELLKDVPNSLAKIADDIYHFQFTKRTLNQSKHVHDRGCSTHPCEKIGRNDLCPCGSGKKYKKCCLH